eukprot:CAMPEP_0206442812 /NCGR_PEP_ID=MMETSP0324_2-20121206/14026_1 /ASSEMBLY_ACC=CAM_ASM_000836 /TAXON_ID=2866 /ORGANISM="Crypthecodinium cohnii, Strain Seligo" /LENGTH=487 /DNA_ID=CAMNT_0053910689 /DNA_START=30 /DNA_END=1493 /DNA_ORIENTATION=+
MGVCSAKKIPEDAGAGGIKIHGAPVSTNSLTCIILASDLGKGALEYCDLMAGAHKQEGFLKKNPFGQVPTLEEPDGFSCGESNAILRYLAVKHNSELYPVGDAKLRARIDWIMASWSAQVYQKWSARIYPILGFAPAPADLEKANKDLKEALDMFTGAFFTGSKFVAGDSLTIADYKVMPFLFGLSLPFAEKKTGVKLSPALAKYVQDAMGAMKTSGILTSNGGWSVKEFMETKTDFPDYTGTTLVVGESATLAPVFAKGAAAKDEKTAKIWGMPASGNSVAAILCAMDAGIGGMEMCNLMEGAHMKPEFLAKNPFHQIPTYEGSDGFCVAESTAILRFIASNYAPALYPGGAKEKALIDWSMDLMSGTIYDIMAIKLFYPVFGFAPAPADQKAENDATLDLLAKYEKAFLSGGKKFVAGDKISIAEYKAVPLLFACMQPSIEKKTGFKMPARMVKYVEDAMAQMKNGSFLSSAGGYSIKEYAASKE